MSGHPIADTANAARACVRRHRERVAKVRRSRCVARRTGAHRASAGRLPIPHLRKSDLGLLKSDPYLNCGVMIFHLKKMREMGFEQTSIKCIEQKADQLILLEQDVMNMCFQKEMGILDASWNVPIRALFHKKYLGQSVHTFWPKILHFILYAKKSREKGIKPWMHPKDGRHVWRTDPQKIPFYMRTYWAYRDVGGFD